jgi:hypothetical protein
MVIGNCCKLLQPDMCKLLRAARWPMLSGSRSMLGWLMLRLLRLLRYETPSSTCLMSSVSAVFISSCSSCSLATKLHDGRQSRRAADPIGPQTGEPPQLGEVQGGPRADVQAGQRGHLPQDCWQRRGHAHALCGGQHGRATRPAGEAHAVRCPCRWHTIALTVTVALEQRRCDEAEEVRVTQDLLRCCRGTAGDAQVEAEHGGKGQAGQSLAVVGQHVEGLGRVRGGVRVVPVSWMGCVGCAARVPHRERLAAQQAGCALAGRHARGARAVFVCGAGAGGSCSGGDSSNAAASGRAGNRRPRGHDGQRRHVSYQKGSKTNTRYQARTVSPLRCASKSSGTSRSMIAPGLPITLELNMSLCEIFNVILFFGGGLGATPPGKISWGLRPQIPSKTENNRDLT